MSVAKQEWRDPGPMMRLAALQMDPLAVEVIAEYVAGGGTLRKFAREKKLPRGPLLVWLMSDEGRWALYRRALIAGGLSERTLRTTWSQLRSSSAVTAPVTAVANPRPR